VCGIVEVVDAADILIFVIGALGHETDRTEAIQSLITGNTEAVREIDLEAVKGCLRDALVHELYVRVSPRRAWKDQGANQKQPMFHLFFSRQ
jgi:hypothetical protein